MKQIDITGRLIDECILQLKLTRIKNLIKELEDDIEDYENRYGADPDYSTFLRASRFLR